jgi:hypothetical protein
MLEIINQMYVDEKLIDLQKYGIIVCLKKYLGLPRQNITGHSPS